MGWLEWLLAGAGADAAAADAAAVLELVFNAAGTCTVPGLYGVVMCGVTGRHAMLLCNDCICLIPVATDVADENVETDDATCVLQCTALMRCLSGLLAALAVPRHDDTGRSVALQLVGVLLGFGCSCTSLANNAVNSSLESQLN